MGRSTWQKGLPARLKNYELLQDNEIDDYGDFIHFSFLAESEPFKIEKSLSDPKWIYSMKEELESIKKNKTWELVYYWKERNQLV